MSRVSKLIASSALTLVVVAVALFVPMDFGKTRIVSEADIARPPADVYAYVTTPGHWPEWHPSSLAVRGAVDHSLAVGESVEEDFSVAGRTGRVTWRVTAREPDRYWRIAGTIGGREAGTVSYTLTPTAGGTHFLREFEYGAPNLLFALLDRVRIRNQVDEESRIAVRRLKQRLEAPI
ncbi:SRPBCC family protein [Variovorax ureilyticus]|uniref:SRPBCC family protein n=1 Tax=Variovorax ureilyticus TaxID=1836198 RepID=A0ABU8VER8_9BURK